MAKSTLRIDIHNHVIPNELLEAITADPARYRMRIETRMPR